MTANSPAYGALTEPPPAPTSTLDPANPCNAADIYGEADIPFARRQELILAIHRCGADPASIPAARKTAEQKLAWLTTWCNFRIWNEAHVGPAPTPRQRTELRNRAAQPDHKEYRQNALEVAAMRYLLEGIAYEEKSYLQTAAQANASALKAQEEAQLLAEFEVHEAADKQKRFEAWKAKR